MPLLRNLVILLTLWAVPVGAGPVSDFTLENGLQVVVIEDHRAPVAVNMIWYRVGAGDERPGTSGIAHFLEHLMFKGTDEIEPGEFSRIVKAQGGSDNAFTSWDYTAYFQRVAADRLDLMMQLEADRMTDLRLTAPDVDTERDVILEERNQRIENDPGALFREQMRAAQYLNHPYGVPIIGWQHEMQALSKADALRYYQTYYAPNNAVLVVAGDVTPDQVRELAQARYGALAPSDALPMRARPQEPPQRAERRVVFQDARVAQPYLMRSYLAPERDPGDQGRAAALTYLAELLGGEGATSFLGQRMQFDAQLAVYTGASYSGVSLDDTTFDIYVMPAPGVSLADAEAALDAALTTFMDKGVDADLFASLKTQLRASEIYDRDNIQGLARRYGAALSSGLTIADVQDWPQVLQAVTPQDVMAAARDLLDRDRAVTGWLTRPAADMAEVTQ